MSRSPNSFNRFVAGREPSVQRAEKLWTTMVTLGTARAPVPKSVPWLNFARDTGCFHPHRHGDGITPTDQGMVVVIHNPQPLLPLLDTFLSSSLNGDWGHGRKDKLR